LLILLCAFKNPGVAAAEPRLNQIQVIGSHNSYHIAPAPSVMALIAAASRKQADALDYTHPPLGDQFGRLGIRQIELDVFADPKGGLYASPAARGILKAAGKDPGPDPNVDGRLDKPGFKVLHVADVDYLSTAPTFVNALEQIRDWSRANRRHVPIFVLVELKDSGVPTLPTRPVKFDRSLLDQLDAEILSVFQRDQILTPDRVRGKYATLPEAIKGQGWPPLEEVRGLVMFGMDNEGKLPALYLEDHPALEHRILFTGVDESSPAAAFFKLNDPIKDFDKIQRLVKAGYLVRTRADADTVQARRGDTTQRDRALASGAQFVSTDYREADNRLSRYSVHLESDAVARINPVSGAGLDRVADVEKMPASDARKAR
jgi:hypothetical protein